MDTDICNGKENIGIRTSMDPIHVTQVRNSEELMDWRHLIL